MIAACAANGPAPRADYPPRPADATEARVVRVIDGDSINVDSGGDIVEVRMIGINANEHGECYSEEAFDYLIERTIHTRVALEIVGTDQFDRALANVWLDDELVNLTLVASGRAIAQTPDPDNPNGAALVAAEAEAHDSGLGLWSANACGPAGQVPDVRIDLEGSIVDPPGADGDRLDEEYMIVANLGRESADIAGWTLRDESSRNRMTFPAGTTLAPGEQIEIRSGCAGPVSWCTGSPIWNNDGDMALLLDQYGNVVARARY